MITNFRVGSKKIRVKIILAHKNTQLNNNLINKKSEKSYYKTLFHFFIVLFNKFHPGKIYRNQEHTISSINQISNWPYAK